jgi:ubiquinone/menaquinone biosynthesis C-methylase UbiE
MKENPAPEGDHIYDLYTTNYKPQLIRIALELDVFSPLANGPASAEAVARSCRCDPAGMQHLLDYLSSLSLLEKAGNGYTLGVDAATFLVRGRKAYVGDLIMRFAGPIPFNSLGESVHTGKPKSVDRDIDFAQDAWIESFRQARIAGSLEMWARAGIVPDASTHMQILDVACGCAIKSLVLAKKTTGIRITCLDSALVLESARDLAERWGVTGQVHFLPADMLTIDLGEGKYDACLVGQITHYLTERQDRDLFARIRRALVDSGKLLLDVPMATPAVDEESSFCSLFLWANSGGRAYSFEEYSSWLMAAGFTNIVPLSERQLCATR